MANSENTIATNPQVFNRSSMLEKVDGDVDTLNAVLAVFIEDSQRILALAQSALLDKNLAVVQQEAHTLKGASGSICAGTLYSQALKLENAARSQNVAEVAQLLTQVAQSFCEFQKELEKYPQSES